MLLVFDWDGTLIDSTGKIIHCMQTAAKHCELPVASSMAVKNIIGLGLPEAIHTLYPTVELEHRHLLQKTYSDVYLEVDKTPCPFFPGVEDCIDNLLVSGHKIAIATGKSRRGLNRVLGNIGWLDKFDATRCADETSSKPHPQMLLELMHELQTSPADTWMIGDTEYDLAMASNAAIKSVGVSYGAHEPARLLKHSPLAVIDNIKDLLDLMTV